MKKSRDVIGQLRDQLTVQSFSVSFDGVGQEQIAWTDEATVWCSVKEKNTGDGEQFLGDVQTVTQMLEFTIRYRATLNEKKRIRYKGKVYDMINQMPDARYVYQKITCQLRQ